MKKIILSAFVLSIASLSFAQHSHVQFGIKGGVNIATLRDDADNDINSRVGFHAGGLAHIHLSKEFAIQPEVLFSTQGAKYANDAKNKFDYLNVPVLAQYMFGEGFRIQTGPQVGFLLSSKSEIGGVELNTKDQLQTVDFAWAFGAGYLFPNTGVGIDARFNLGLTDISKNDGGLKSRVWQFGLFYQFKH